MIPLAQYLSDMQDDEFVPFRAVERRAPLPASTRAETPVMRTLKAVPPRPLAPAAAVLRPIEVETVPLAELTAARDRWAGERDELEQAAATAREDALRDQETSLRAAIAAEHEASLETLRAELVAAHAEALAAERERWTGEQADRLADLMILQMAVFEDAMRATVRGVLRPLATEARQRQAIADLADAVKVIAPEGGEYRIAATGPSDLLDKFRARLGDKAERVSVRADESVVDIRVEADATTIETRLEAWGEELEKALS